MCGGGGGGRGCYGVQATPAFVSAWPGGGMLVAWGCKSVVLTGVYGARNLTLLL